MCPCLKLWTFSNDSNLMLYFNRNLTKFICGLVKFIHIQLTTLIYLSFIFVTIHQYYLLSSHYPQLYNSLTYFCYLFLQYCRVIFVTIVRNFFIYIYIYIVQVNVFGFTCIFIYIYTGSIVYCWCLIKW